MKKFLLFTFALLLIIPLTVGCAVSTKYKDVYNALDEFVNSAKYSEYFSGNIIIAGATKMEEGFCDLVSYDSLMKMSLTNIKNCYGAFVLEPYYNKGAIRKVCDNVLRELDKYKLAVDNFVEGKTYLENICINFGSTSDQAKMELQDFKDDYGKLIEKSVDLQTTFTTAFTKLYHPDITSEIETSFDVKVCICEVFNSLVYDCVQYSLVEFDYIFGFPTNLFYSLKTLQSTISSTTTFNTANYSKWLDTYQLFKNEEKMFLNSLDSLDLKGKDAESFNGMEKTKYEKINNFVSTNASFFIDKTIGFLC